MQAWLLPLTMNKLIPQDREKVHGDNSICFAHSSVKAFIYNFSSFIYNFILINLQNTCYYKHALTIQNNTLKDQVNVSIAVPSRQFHKNHCSGWIFCLLPTSPLRSFTTTRSRSSTCPIRPVRLSMSTPGFLL